MGANGTALGLETKLRGQYQQKLRTIIAPDTAALSSPVFL